MLEKKPSLCKCYAKLADLWISPDEKNNRKDKKGHAMVKEETKKKKKRSFILLAPWQDRPAKYGG